MKRRGALRLALAGLVAASGARAAAESGPQLVIEPTSFDFGEALQERTLEKEFRFSNQGDADLVIEKIVTSCGCTVVGAYASVVAPGSATTVRIKLSTRKASGRISRSVLIRSNDPGPPRELRLEATVVEDTAE